MSELIFSHSSAISIASNTFINVPIILRYKGEPLIHMVNDLLTGYSISIPIYHPDGTQLAVSVNSRLYPTEAGKKAGLTIEKHPQVWTCKMGSQELFEIRQQGANSFKTTAELYTKDGFFIKCEDNPVVSLFKSSGLLTKKFSFYGNTMSNCQVGIDIIDEKSINIGGMMRIE